MIEKANSQNPCFYAEYCDRLAIGCRLDSESQSIQSIPNLATVEYALTTLYADEHIKNSCLRYPELVVRRDTFLAELYKKLTRVGRPPKPRRR